MDEHTLEQRFDAFLERDAERWRAHEAEVAALKLTVSALVMGLVGIGGQARQVAHELSMIEMRLGPEAHPAGPALIRDVRHALEAGTDLPAVDGRAPGHDVVD